MTLWSTVRFRSVGFFSLAVGVTLALEMFVGHTMVDADVLAKDLAKDLANIGSRRLYRYDA